MITEPFILEIILLSTTSIVFFLARRDRYKILFKYLPAPLWCYFIPTVISTVGWIPSDSPLYSWISRSLLPTSLILLLIGTDLSSICRLSHKALGSMFVGTLGIFIGGIVSFIFLFKLQSIGKIPLVKMEMMELWKGWGSLSASWTGGSANMVAVQEILQAPESLFSNLIIVDTIVAYTWMALLVFISKYQEPINRKLGVHNDGELFLFNPYLIEKESAFSPENRTNSLKKFFQGVLVVLSAFSVGHLCWLLSKGFPSIGTILNRFTWTMILATTLPLLLSTTRAKNLEKLGASQFGTFFLYLLLTSIGARANLSTLVSAPLFILSGILWVAICGLVLISFAKLFKIPLSLIATASQANIGGPISASIVASVYRKDLAPVGIILGVLGGIYGTTFGLLFSKICRIITDLL